MSSSTKVDLTTITYMKSVILSCPVQTPLTINQFLRDYKLLTTGSLPYSQYGYSTAKEMLFSLTDIFEFSRNNGEDIISLRKDCTDEATHTIRTFIEKTKKKSRCSKRRSHTLYGNRSSYKCNIPAKTAQHRPTYVQRQYLPQLDDDTKSSIFKFVERCHADKINLTVNNFLSHFNEYYGYRFDFIKCGFGTMPDFFQHASSIGLLKVTLQSNGIYEVSPKSVQYNKKIESNVYPCSDTLKFKQFIENLVATKTGYPLNSLSRLYQESVNGDINRILRSTGTASLYAFINQLSKQKLLSLVKSSSESWLIGPPSSSSTSVILSGPDERKYPSGGPHLVRIITVDSFDNIQISMENETNSNKQRLSSTLENICIVKLSLVPSIMPGLVCLYRLTPKDYVRVEVKKIEAKGNENIFVTVQPIDYFLSLDPILLPTNDLFLLSSELHDIPRCALNVGLSPWTHHMHPNEQRLNKLQPGSVWLSFRSSTSFHSSTRVDFVDSNYENSLSQQLVNAGFATW